MSVSEESFNSDFEILPEDYKHYDLSFKIIVIGDSGVGKSCITNKAIRNVFELNYNATVGFEFSTFIVKLNNKVIKLKVFDTCGQELYRSLATQFYRNSSLAIIVYSVTNEESFDNVEMWLREIRAYNSPDIKVFLIGNKIDLVDERKVSTEDGESYAKTNKANKFLESSAKTGINVQEIFVEAAKLLYADYTLYNGSENTSGFISKPEQEPPKKKKKGCC